MNWHKCLFYGSLRKGQYNYDRMLSLFGKNSVRYIKTVDVLGYALYNTGRGYPAIVKSNSPNTVAMDVFEIDDKVYSWVNGMELSAGYILVEHKVGNNIYYLYAYRSVGSDFTLVESGDWAKQNELF